ncbi:MAG: TlpA disulfide reductase family protein [Imperialibacter sp.]|uniref:peroxiredoxin family protein n=1 Tax=Imperialibacter sp. TaxID=2038411 RepID=UPI0032EBC7D4
MMKYLSVLLLGTVLFTSCADATQQDGLKISGKVKFPQESGIIQLEMLGLEGIDPIDTLTLAADSTFEAYVKITEPSFLRINFYGKQVVPLVLDKSDVYIEVEAYSPQAPFSVTGSKDTEYFEAAGKLNAKFQSDVQMINNDYSQAMMSGDIETAGKIREQYIDIEASFSKNMKKLIWSMDNSVSAIFALNYMDAEAQFPFFDSLATRFQNGLPDSRFTKELVTRVDNMRALAVGAMAPEINLPNPDGESIALSSLRGKYVLVDFWAAWCKPCRQENPNVLASYNRYKDKGFEILGVSLDRTRDAWLQAIEDDGLTWKHVSDLKYFNSEAAATYQINAIPATYLIGPDGKIVAKNLRGESLERKLEEIFG